MRVYSSRSQSQGRGKSKKGCYQQAKCVFSRPAGVFMKCPSCKMGRNTKHHRKNAAECSQIIAQKRQVIAEARVGMKKHYLTLEKCLGSPEKKGYIYLCRCKCGGSIEVIYGDFVAGKNRSFGCKNTRNAKPVATAQFKPTFFLGLPVFL